VAAAAETQANHRLKVPLQGLQRLSPVRQVPQVDVVVRAAGREDLAVAPPRQGVNVVRVFKRRKLLAAVQIAELNGAVADNGQLATARMEMNAIPLQPRRQVLPRRTRRQFIDADRVIRAAKRYQPAVGTERWERVITALRHLQDRLAASQVPQVVLALIPCV